MKILAAQMEELGKQRQATFIKAMIEAVREAHPEVTRAMTDEQIRARIEQGMRTSRGYGIELEDDVAAYIHLMFALGFDFDQEVRWAREILRREDFNGRIRISLLCAAHEGRIPAPGALFSP